MTNQKYIKEIIKVVIRGGWMQKFQKENNFDVIEGNERRRNNYDPN